MTAGTLLAIDLGSTVTKAVVWSEDGPVGVGRSMLRTDRRAGGLAEQDPTQWWGSVGSACRDATAEAGGTAARAIRGVVFSAARQTFALVDDHGDALRPGIMWSDRRAVAEADDLASSCGGRDAVRRTTGAFLDASSPAAKLAWLDKHEPDVMRRARWMLTPRDFVVQKMTGEVATDLTLAQSSGMYDSSLEVVPGLAGRFDDMLPPVLASSAVGGILRSDAADELQIASGLPVVMGAGDRPCEVLGTGAGPRRPMVSWGTTANVSVPTDEWPEVSGLGLVVSRGGAGGFLIEAGMSSAGSFLDWLASVGAESSVPAELSMATALSSLLERALGSPPGANGVTAVSWLGGARAPWWRDDARGAFVGLSPEHTLGDMARAVVEAVAFEADRCLRAVDAAVGSRATALAMAGGSAMAMWPDILAAVTGLPARGRRSGLAAAAGAALVAGQATGVDLDMELALERLDPAGNEVLPDPFLVERYEAIRPVADRVAEAVLGLGLSGDGGAT